MFFQLKAAVRKRVKALLWRLFTRLDEALPITYAGAQPFATAAPGRAFDSTAAEATALQKTLVVNEDGIIGSMQQLELLLASVFETKTLQGIESELFEHLTKRRDLWIDNDAILSECRTFLLARVQSNDARASKALHALLVHVEKTGQSRRAYLTDGKPNPDALFWPDPTYAKRPRTLTGELPFAGATPILDKTTPIGSAGSCFAMEIAHELQRKGFNYVVTEPYPDAATGLSNACARWGIIFNTPSFRQLVERAFGTMELPRVLWTSKQDGKRIYLDPFREDIWFNSVEEYEADFAGHLKAVREALTTACVFVITLGVNEVWRFKSSGAVLQRSPWRVASALVESHVMTVDENLDQLQRMLDVWRSFNPDLKLIVTVSPVPLHATFRGETQHVVTANTHSKAVLRVVAEEFVARNRDVFYFPSYEVVMTSTADAWMPDLRHVQKHTVERVMQLFDQIFVSPPAAAATREQVK